MNKIIFIALLLLTFIVNVYGHVHLDDEDEHDHEHEGHDHEHSEEHNVVLSVIGIGIIFLFSFFGTVLPVIFRKKEFFATTSILFGSVKLFGIGVITSVAFIHMLIPANELLTNKAAPTFFNTTYPSFAGAFAIIGIIITNGIQVLSSHALHRRALKKDNKLGGSSDSEQTVSTNSYNNSHIGETEKGIVVETVQHEHEDHDCCAGDLKAICHNVENKERQLVSYLLEIGISLHSILIGFVYGLTTDDELVALMIAMVFHQFFEGVALSSIFVEAKFKRLNASLVMIIVYTLTMPIGGIIGLIVHESYDPTSKFMIGLQGGVDAIAGGILIYDALANVLVRHTSSHEWNNMKLNQKGIQLLFFYLGLAAMAIIGLWA